MPIITSLLLAAVLAGPADDLRRAVADQNLERAAEAIEAVKQSGGTRAIRALTQAFGQAAQAEAAVQKEMAELQASVAGEERSGKDYKVKMDDMGTRASALQGIKLAIGLAFGGLKGDLLDEYIKLIKGREDGELRAYLAGPISRSPDLNALFALLDRLTKEKDPRVVVAVLDALAVIKPKDKTVVADICGKLKDPTWSVATAAAVALGRIGSVESVGPLIDALKDAEGKVRYDINAALAAITRVDKHGDHASWADWWKRNEAKVRSGRYVPEPAERAGGKASGTTFYGLPVVSTQPVFVIDASMSMKSKSKWIPKEDPNVPGGLKLTGDSKMAVAQYELKKVLLMLPDGAQFNIVFFHRDVDVFSPVMATINSGTRAAAMRWVDELELKLQTNIYEGVKRAFQFVPPPSKRPKGVVHATVVSGADTLYLLSDGKPTTGIKDVDEFCRAVQDLNRFKKLTIHTIAIQPSKESGEFLERLAKENGGQYAARGGMKGGKKKKKKP